MIMSAKSHFSKKKLISSPFPPKLKGTQFPAGKTVAFSPYPGSNAESIRKAVTRAKKKLKNHQRFFERLGSEDSR